MLKVMRNLVIPSFTLWNITVAILTTVICHVIPEYLPFTDVNGESTFYTSAIVILGFTVIEGIYTKVIKPRQIQNNQ